MDSVLQLLSSEYRVIGMSCSKFLFYEPVSVCTLLTITLAVRGRGPHHPHGQQPVLHQHHHYKPRTAEALTGQAELLHDIKHLEEDSEGLTADKLSKMTPEELDFHYFLTHDFDKNSMLDGLELLKAVYHTIDEEHHHEDDSEDEPESSDLDSFIAMVDRTLGSDDTNGDGYLSYAEYRAARANQSLANRTGTPIVLAVDPPS